MLLIALGSSKSTDILPPWHTCIIKVTNFLLSYYQVSHTFKYVQVGSIIYPPQRRFFWKLTIIFFAPPHLKEKKKIHWDKSIFATAISRQLQHPQDTEASILTLLLFLTVTNSMSCVLAHQVQTVCYIKSVIVWEIKLYWLLHPRRSERVCNRNNSGTKKLLFSGHFVSDAMNNTTVIPTEITLLEYKRYISYVKNN